VLTIHIQVGQMGRQPSKFRAQAGIGFKCPLDLLDLVRFESAEQVT